MKTLIVIPVRMASTRFPNKPMVLIAGKPMIQRVWEQAVLSKVGDVIVACCDKEIRNLILNLGGKVEMTDPNLPSGTDRVFSAIKNYGNINDYDSIINLQGDMPLINPNDITRVNFPLRQGFDIGTLATNFTTEEEVQDENITKVHIQWIKNKIIGKAIDFHKDISLLKGDNHYHHVGIYSFHFETLKKFVSLPTSKNEEKLQLEQLRALDVNMTIGVGYVKDVPIGIDSKEDLLKIEKLINNL